MGFQFFAIGFIGLGIPLLFAPSDSRNPIVGKICRVLHWLQSSLIPRGLRSLHASVPVWKMQDTLRIAAPTAVLLLDTLLYEVEFGSADSTIFHVMHTVVTSGLLEVMSIAWVLYLVFPRYQRGDTEAFPFVAVPITTAMISVAVKTMFDTRGLHFFIWWLWWILLAAAIVARRLGIPPFPILVGHTTIVSSSEADQAFREHNKSRKEQNLAEWKSISLRTPDGEQLFAATHTPAGHDTGKWIVFFNGNAMLAQHMLEHHEDLASRLQCNILAFNYRGCGESTGAPGSFCDLVVDGITAVDYCITRSSNSNDDSGKVLLMGVSLGGTVASGVAAAKYNALPVVIDRSFCDVFDVSLKLGEGILASGYAREVLPFIAYWMVLPLLHICGWHIDSASCLRSLRGDVLLTYHALDGVLPVGCQTHEGVYTAAQRSLFELKWRHPTHDGTTADALYHQYPLTMDPGWATLERMILNMF